MEVKNIETFVANSVIKYLKERDIEFNLMKNKIKKCHSCSECDDIHTYYPDIDFCCCNCKNCKITICGGCYSFKDNQWVENENYEIFCSYECKVEDENYKRFPEEN